MAVPDPLGELARERDQAREVAMEAMRFLSDEQLAEMRQRLDKGEGDETDHDSSGHPACQGE